MRLPARYISGHLVWTYNATVWATWRIEPDCYTYLTVDAKRDLLERVRAALMSAGDEYTLLGLCEPIDPAAVAEAMLDGVDLDANPAWRDVVLSALDRLEDVAVWRRAFFVSVKLPDATGTDLWRQVVRSAEARLGADLGFSASTVPSGEVAARAAQAADIASVLTPRLRMRAASSEELMWINRRAFRRGIDDPVLDDRPTNHGGREAGRPLTEAQLLPLADAELLEGGQRGDADRPLHRRYLRVEVDTAPGDGDPTAVAYQSFLCVSSMPREWAFPGGLGEWYLHADQVAFPVDWCTRVRAMSNADAQNKTRRQHTQLIGQIDEYDAEASGPPSSLAMAIADIDDERRELAENAAEPELHCTIIFAVWAPTLPSVEQRAGQLAALFEPHQYTLHRPTGGQADLFRAMLIGSSLPQVARDYTQYLLPRALASGAPFAGNEIGDPRGMYFADQLDGGTYRPVLIDPSWGPTVKDGHASMGLVGASGGGKSHCIKLLIDGLLARGGQVVALDRTEMAEYSRLAAATPGRAQIVHLRDTALSLDPLRIFEGADRLTYTLGFLTVMLATSPMELDGLELNDAVEAVAKQPDGRMADLVGVLESRNNDTARVLARKLAAVARTSLGQTVFGDRPPLTLGGADLVVFAAQGIDLPTQDQLMNAHLAKRLLPEQILAQGLVYLVAAVTQRVAMSNLARFTLCVFDEVWALTNTVEGLMLLMNLVHDGRKHNAAALLAGQDAADFGNKELRDLLAIRWAFRQDHRSAARRSLEFMDLDADNDALIDLLVAGGAGSGLRRGQCLHRDVHGRVGCIEIVPAWSSQLDEAMESNPERVVAIARHRARPPDIEPPLPAVASPEEPKRAMPPITRLPASGTGHTAAAANRPPGTDATGRPIRAAPQPDNPGDEVDHTVRPSRRPTGGRG